MKQNLVRIVGPNTAQAFWQRWQENFINGDDFRHLSALGFTCVRLPINAKNIIADFKGGEVALAPLGVAPIDQAAKWAAASGLTVILDLHAAPGGQNSLATVADVPSNDKVARLWEGQTATSNQTLTIALWRALARRYATSPAIGGYDLLNEPQLPKGAAPHTLAVFYQALIAAVRSVDPSHLVIIEGDKFAHDFSDLHALKDNNLMYEFHEYALFNSDWKTPNQAALDPFLQLRTDTNRPIWLGEFGEDSLEWQQQMVNLMRANHIGWAVWPWKRIDHGLGHPVIATIAIPDSWEKLARYLDDAFLAQQLSPEEASQAMAEMLDAIRTVNCSEDAELAAILAGRK